VSSSLAANTSRHARDTALLGMVIFMASWAMLFASLVDDPSSDPAFEKKPKSAQDKERERLLGIIRGLSSKDVSERSRVFKMANTEISRSCDGKLPSLVDTFCGGGSIPLEAQRLGLPVYASDLNPVAVKFPPFSGQVVKLDF
jgi:putative DNA methylase